jgi:hypothetical protein
MFAYVRPTVTAKTSDDPEGDGITGICYIPTVMKQASIGNKVI